MSNAEVSAGLGKGKGNAASAEPAFGRALGLNRSAIEIEASQRIRRVIERKKRHS